MPLCFFLFFGFFLGDICLGKESVCRTAFGDDGGVESDKFIRGMAYLGIDTEAPRENYFMAMISEVHLYKVLDILASCNNWRDGYLSNELRCRKKYQSMYGNNDG